MTEAVRYEIEHVSRYRYDAPARQCMMLLCLKPREDRGQRLLHFAIEAQPPAHLNPEADCFGNTRHVLDLHRPHEALDITTRATVEAPPATPLPERLGPGAWEEIRALGGSFADWDYTRPSALTRPSPALAAFTAHHGIEPGRDPLESLLRLSDTLHRRLCYVPGSTSVESSVEHVLETGRGVCQDYAHVMIAVARSWGVPARYVSGYLHVTGLPGEQTPDNATHAWVECRLPGFGWVGFDPTNRNLAGEHHVRIAVGRDYRDVSPTRGVRQGGGEARLEVDVRVREDAGRGRRHDLRTGPPPGGSDSR